MTVGQIAAVVTAVAAITLVVIAIALYRKVSQIMEAATAALTASGQPEPAQPAQPASSPQVRPHQTGLESEDIDQAMGRSFIVPPAVAAVRPPMKTATVVYGLRTAVAARRVRREAAHVMTKAGRTR